MANILEVKTTSPDYVGQDPEAAAKDFRERIKNYERVYQTIDESERHLSYVKITNIGHQVIINRLQDYLSTRLCYYLTNLHIKPRSIWLSRHGESEFNLEGKIGGDANISSRGEQYARMLPELVRRSGVPRDQPLTVWISTLKRTAQTARHLVAETGWNKLDWKALDELDSGVCDGMTVISTTLKSVWQSTNTLSSTLRSNANTLKISRLVMKTSTTTDIEEENHIAT